MRMSYLLKSMLVTSAFGLGACGGDTTTKITTDLGEAPNAVVLDHKSEKQKTSFEIPVAPGGEFIFDASDSNDKETDVDKLEFYWNGEKGTDSHTYTASVLGSIDEISFYVKDEQGNKSDLIKISVEVKEPGAIGSKPDVSLSQTTGTIKVGDTKTITVTVDDKDATTTYTIDGGDQQTLTGTSIEIDATDKDKDDEIVLVVTSTNDEGPTTKTATFTVTDVAEIPVISLSSTSADIQVGTTKEITVSVTDANAETTYSIDGGTTVENVINGKIIIDATGKSENDIIELVVNASNDAGDAEEVTGSYKVTDEVIVPQKPVLALDKETADVEKNEKITVEVTVVSDVAATTTYSVDGGDDVETSDKTISIEIDATGKDKGDEIKLIVNSTNEGGEAVKLTGTYTVTEGQVVPPTETEFTWDNALIYFVIPDRFENGDSANDHSYGRINDGLSDIGTFHGGDIVGLTSKLDYLDELGVNAIWVTAPYEQIHGYVAGGDGDFPHYAYHGYYPLDYTMMDKNMGTVEEFRTFVDSAHEKGIRVVMDVVMNHAGYNTLIDAAEYGFGGVSMSLTDAQKYMDNGNYNGFHEKFNYLAPGLKPTPQKIQDWATWWGSGWVRAGLPGYTEGGGDDLTKNLNFLPDFRTDQSNSVGLAPLLATKWAMESSGYDNWIIPAAAGLRTDLNVAPADYIVKWLASWVEEFGIDGFRVDTAKHVEQYRWKQLKDASKEALSAWRANNPDDAAADWNDDFWMTGEHWNFAFGDDKGYFNNGFDSMINFSFKGSASDLASNWQVYADKINNDANYNVLSYISSHDSALTRGDMTKIGTNLILLPGGVQIFYGDETARSFGNTGSDPFQGTRSQMNWGENADTLAHWQKLGQFRRNNPAVGAGSHEDLGNSTFGRKWTGSTGDNNVVIVINASGTVDVNVDGYFADGVEVRNAYDDAVNTVINGKVSFDAGSNGVILVEAK